MSDRFRELINRLRDFGDFYDPDDYMKHYSDLEDWVDDEEYDDSPIERDEEEEDE